MGLKLSIYYIEKVAEGNRASRRSSFALDSFKIIANIKEFHCRQDKKQINGAVAQLGACLNGIQEVAGSIPASSIFYIKGLAIFAEPFLFGQYGCCIMGNDSVFITFEGFPL